MCMCGGFLEVGLISLAVGYISKKIHKCKCECHEEVKHECCHCQEESNKKRNKYKIIQIILGGLIIGSIIMITVGIIKEHCHIHNDSCGHIERTHH